MDPTEPVLERLLRNNGQWVQAVLKTDKDFFERSAEGQSPQVLWIGCSDSRVPESVITGSKPGDIFSHRNIANQVHPDDDSVLSVVEFSVAYLKVKHVIVVGHTNCGGAKHCLEAAGRPPEHPGIPLLRWLEPLTDLARSLDLGSYPPAEALSILVRENVKQQVRNLADTDTIKAAWARCQDVQLHGWIYDLSTGLLDDNPDIPTLPHQPLEPHST